MATDVLLINPPNDDAYKPIHRSGIYFPLGILSVATYLKHNTPSVNVEMIDGQLTSQEEILQRIQSQTPNIVGISPTICSYHNSTEEAIAAHDIGAKVVYGGVHATELAIPILGRRKFIDAVVLGDGEVAFWNYVNGITPSEINNLAYRNSNGGVVSNDVQLLDLASIPLPDFRLIDLQPNFQNFRRVYPDRDFQRPVSIYTQKGCVWRQKTKGCVYCSRGNAKPRYVDSERVWNHISKAVEEYGVDFVMDVVDDFLQNKKWFQAFVEATPNNAPHFMVYTRADRIDAKTAHMLKRMNCYEVFIGIESGNQRILDHIPKGVTVEQNRQVGRTLKEEGIYIYPQAVLGLPGETQETLEDTVKLMEDICEHSIVDEIGPNILMPLPGSRSFAMLNESCNGKYENTDDLDIEEMKREWVSRFCGVSYDKIEEAVERICSLSIRASEFTQRG